MSEISEGWYLIHGPERPHLRYISWHNHYGCYYVEGKINGHLQYLDKFNENYTFERIDYQASQDKEDTMQDKAESEDDKFSSDLDMVRLGDNISGYNESDDECERCGVGGVIRTYVEGERSVPCPNCTDDSEEKPDEYIPSAFKGDCGVPDRGIKTNYNTGEVIDSDNYSEPRPEDDGLEGESREMFYDDRPTQDIEATTGDLRDYVKSLEDELFQEKLEINQCLVHGMQKDREISELQEQLEDVREERDEWKLNWMQRGTKLTEFQQERDNLRERIEEAREHLKSVVDDDFHYHTEEALEILTQNSDEGGI